MGAQLFADYASLPHFIYSHFLEDFGLEECIKVKVGFERVAATHSVSILHYRADNGRFADEDFHTVCIASSEIIDFCAPRVHFQNGIAECNIGIIQDSTRSILLHAMHH